VFVEIPDIQIGGRYRIKKSSLDRDVLRQDKQSQPTVLVVDDDLGVQDLFRTFLKQTGLFKMFDEGIFQIRISRRLGHFRQRLG
jgi:hypothetical protein